MQEVNVKTRKIQTDLPLEGKVAAERPDEVYGYTILPDGTRHEFVIEGWEEYNRTVDRSYDGNPDREVTDHGKHNCLL